MAINDVTIPFFKWTVDETCNFLDTIDLSVLKPKFVAANIDGETLEGFTELMVGEVCKDDFRLRVKLLKAIAKLKESSTSDFLVIPGVNNQNDARDVVVAVNNDRPSSFGNWPIRYPLPSFPRQVQDALNKEDKTIICAARTCLRTQLIQSLFEDITSKYTWYPNSMQYLEVISALCAKYSYLSDYSMPGCKKNGSPSSILLESLKNKFKKERMPLINNEDVLLAKKKFGKKGYGKKHKRFEDSEIEENEKTPRQIQYFPLMEDELVDEVGTMLLLDEMLQESSKIRPNYEVMLDRQKRTCVHRTKDIQNKSTIDIMAAYPWMSLPKLILTEVKILFNKDLDRELRVSLARIASKVLDIVSKKKEQLLSSILTTIEGEQDEVKKKEMMMNTAVFMLPRLFKGDCSDHLFVAGKMPVVNSPTIVFDFGNENMASSPKITIVLDYIEVMRDDFGTDNVLALACLIGVHYLYNAKYHPKISNTLKFVQHALIGLSGESDDLPMPVRCVTNLLMK
ncbi:uncharacterized protein LOC105845782 isoform X5 [Hydra vulgaris]|uniref:uncharacterized protein LOC105845782 isoform X5 n=1 Tax=Hydra vulgaris TaxID=6087 RepID=UPI001F5EDAE2|nr:uncharacterized protein LOC105845782 isoform X5 [Hydra vulgaris]